MTKKQWVTLKVDQGGVSGFVGMFLSCCFVILVGWLIMLFELVWF